MPPKLQSEELWIVLEKDEEQIVSVPCLSIIVVSDDEDEEGIIQVCSPSGQQASSPIYIFDSPTYGPESP